MDDLSLSLYFLDCFTITFFFSPLPMTALQCVVHPSEWSQHQRLVVKNYQILYFLRTQRLALY
jgi:hypothetical protein